jgi:hypothetical protein
MMNGTLCKTSQGNESFPDARATARVAPTIDDNLAMPTAIEYGRGDPCGRPGFTRGRPGFTRGRPGFTRGRPGFTRGRPGFTRGRPGFTRGRSDSLVHNTTDTPAPQDLFATAPMKATWREFNWQREEEAYTSFEAAISNRVLALKERHINTYMETGASRSVASALHTLASVAIIFWHKVCSRRVWPRGLLLAGLALMLVLVGFDLMGLLVLYAR